MAEKFEPLVFNQDSTVTYHEWKAWKQSLIYYLAAKDITDSGRKKAVLLHRGGRKLQEVFESLELADPKAAKEAKDPFEFTISALEEHFRPTTNKFYERYLFHQIRQGDDSIEQFVVKLRKQAANCSFKDVHDSIVDQIIEGTSSDELRKDILKKCLTKLTDIVELGKLSESVRVQASTMAGEPQGEAVSRVRDQKSSSSFAYQKPQSKTTIFDEIEKM